MAGHASISEDCPVTRAEQHCWQLYSPQQMRLRIWLPSQLSGKQVSETHLPVFPQLLCTVHISCWEENRISWRENILMFCSLRYYITLIPRMLETSCFPNTSHFEIYTVAMLRPFRHWLSFWTPFSSAVVWGVNLGAWLSETWGLVKAAFKSSDWLKASSLLLLSCGSELHCMLPSPRAKSGSCPHPGPWLWTPLLYHLAAFPTQATLLHFLLP